MLRQAAIRLLKFPEAVCTIYLSKNAFLSSFSPSKSAYAGGKAVKMASSIEFYLRNVQSYENMLEEEREKFDNGKKFLARMMGQDFETFDQTQIDEAIRYLFPSGLKSLKGRPKFKPPEEVYPERKKIQFDKTGRPFHDLYYTGKPAFYEALHKASCHFEELNFLFDRGYIFHDYTAFKNEKPLILASSDWLSKEELSRKLLENINDKLYDQWLRVMTGLSEHPLAWHKSEFILSYRKTVLSEVTKDVYPEPAIDPETNKQFVDTFGQKKHAFAELRMLRPGSGQFMVNGKRMLEVFPELGNREQIMFPLQFTGNLGAVDVVAKVSDAETGTSSRANALRLALARALACFFPGDLGYNRLRAAGLLTQDERFRERKKPGQKKARKKPIWKAR